MTPYRDLFLSDVNCAVEMCDRELRIAIAREVFQFEQINVRSSGAITGYRAGLLTTRPEPIPDWINSAVELESLEDVLRRESLWDRYRMELGRDVQAASNRRRCEAALSTFRSSSN